MSYSNPISVSYSFPTAVTDITLALAPPVNCTRARVKDINVSVTTTYNAVTTSAKVKVGVSGSLDVLGYVDIGTTAAGAAAGFGSQYIKNTNPSLDSGVLTLGGANNTLSGTHPVVSGPILITFTANTGGTPAGAGTATVTIDWY